MPTKHSIITLLVCITLLFTACSQARYGSRMVRVKSDKVAQEKVLKKKSNIVKSETASLPVLKNKIEQDDESKKSQVDLETNKVQFSNTVKNTNRVAEKEISSEETIAITENIINENDDFASLPAQKIIPKKVVKAAKSIQKKVAKTNDERGLITTILLVILILILLSLLLDLLPPIVSWILSIVILVVLILWLLQML